MKFFLDTFDPRALEWAQQLGVVHGVTTNPVLIAKSGRSPAEVLADLSSVAGAQVESISVQLMLGTPEERLREAERLRGVSPWFCAKLGFGEESLRIGNRLREVGIPTNITLVFSAAQAALAAAAGARYVSVFVSRMENTGNSGLSVVRSIARFRRPGAAPATQLLAASLRTGWHVVKAFEAGADIVTVSPDLLRTLLAHPHTERVASEFRRAAEEVELPV